MILRLRVRILIQAYWTRHSVFGTHLRNTTLNSTWSGHSLALSETSFLHNYMSYLYFFHICLPLVCSWLFILLGPRLSPLVVIFEFISAISALLAVYSTTLQETCSSSSSTQSLIGLFKSLTTTIPDWPLLHIHFWNSMLAAISPDRNWLWGHVIRMAPRLDMCIMKTKRSLLLGWNPGN